MRAVQHSQDDQGRGLDAIDDDKGRTRHNKFAGTRHPPRPAALGKVREAADERLDRIPHFDRRDRIVSADVSQLGVEVTHSLG